MKFILGLALVMCSLAAQAGGLHSLEQFLTQVRAGQASFTQTVRTPAKAGAVARVKTSRGRFAFERPGRFRFDYSQPFAQTMVADGSTLWLYDPDLNQVTARAQAAALGNTPAALLASAPDMSSLRQQFVLSDGPQEEGLQWVLATPLNRDGTVRSVRLGFVQTTQGGQALPVVQVLEMEDSFGQVSVLRFEQFQANPVLPSATFVFTPPAGADVLRQ